MDRNEAIEIIRKNLPDGRHQLSEALETLIPELAESEDERIRKQLIKETKGSEIRLFEIVTNDEFVAWLEKQGSQNLVDKVELKFKAGDKVISTISNIPYYITEVCNGYYLTDVGCIIMFNAQDNFELVGHNSAWSEEDEKTTQRIVDTIMKYAISPHSIINGDKPNLEYAKEFESWLKSLKFRIQPQWKPSEEQMEAVRIAAEIGTANNSWAMDVLKSMHQDLKNLKG